MTNSIKFVQASLQVSESIGVDCYMLPNGEKRIGITGAALAARRSKEYLSRMVAKSNGKQLKTLQKAGFQGYLLVGNVIRSDGRSCDEWKGERVKLTCRRRAALF